MPKLPVMPITVRFLCDFKMRFASFIYHFDTAFSIGEIPCLEDSYYTKEELALLSDETFCRMVRSFGAERVLFGSDSPWTDQKRSKEQILSMPLTPEEKAMILGGNAQKLLGL